jgi:hypothetical protein
MKSTARVLLALALTTVGGCATYSRLRNPPITRSFPTAGVSRVIVRAGHADSAVVITDSLAAAITISGTPRGGAGGFHPGRLYWRNTPASEWGLSFVTARHGDALIVSTRNEIYYIHHYYALDSLRIRVPPNVELVLQNRKLNGDGAPDLTPP